MNLTRAASRWSLRWKLALLFGGIVLAAGGGVAWQARTHASALLARTLSEQAATLARQVTEEIDPKLLRDLQERVEATPEADRAALAEDSEVVKLQERLDQIRRLTGLKYLYTVFALRDGRIAYGVDGSPPGSEDATIPGDVEPEPDESLIRVLKEGVPTQSPITETTAYGTLVTSYHPIRYQGTLVGALGADFDAEAAARGIRDLQRRILGVMALVLVLSLGLTYLAASRIARPLLQVARLAARGQEGDLTFSREDFGTLQQDEIGAMADALAEMVDRQKDFLREVRQETETTRRQTELLADLADRSGHAAEAIRQAVERLETTSEDCAAALQESYAGMEEVASAACAAAASAGRGSELAARTEALSSQAFGQVQEVLRDVAAGARGAQTSGQTLERVGHSVEAIEGFLGRIQAIADQTNLLALNAAIEAARAGEAGRGFAVVAEEVRKLAEDSREAAQEVGRRMEDLSRDTREALESHREGRSRLEEALGAANRMERELQETLERIGELGGVMQDMAAASQEQAATGQEMTASMDQISRATQGIVEALREVREQAQTGAEAARQVTRSSQTLAEGAARAEDQVKRFRTEAP